MIQRLDRTAKKNGKQQMEVINRLMQVLTDEFRTSTARYSYDSQIPVHH
jgi:hypothetical protein